MSRWLRARCSAKSAKAGEDWADRIFTTMRDGVEGGLSATDLLEDLCDDDETKNTRIGKLAGICPRNVAARSNTQLLCQLLQRLAL